MDTTEILIIVLGSNVLVAVVTSFVNGFFNRRKSSAEASKLDAYSAKTIVDMATKASKQLVEDYQKQSSLLENKLSSVRSELQEANQKFADIQTMATKLSIGLDLLVAQLKIHGHNPLVTLDHIDKFTTQELRTQAVGLDNERRRRFSDTQELD